MTLRLLRRSTISCLALRQYREALKDLNRYLFKRRQVTPPKVSPIPVEVLLLDDNAAEWHLVQQVVAGRSDSIRVRITTTADCKGALAILSNGTPNLVIADMGVLECGGVELMRQCQLRGIPVVIFSGSLNPAHEVEALRLGAKQFVRKPLELGEYAEAVWTMIANWAVRSSSTTAGTMYRLEIHPHTRGVVFP